MQQKVKAWTVTEMYKREDKIKIPEKPECQNSNPIKLGNWKFWLCKKTKIVTPETSNKNWKFRKFRFRSSEIAKCKIQNKNANSTQPLEWSPSTMGVTRCQGIVEGHYLKQFLEGNLNSKLRTAPKAWLFSEFALVFTGSSVGKSLQAGLKSRKWSFK